MASTTWAGADPLASHRARRQLIDKIMTAIMITAAIIGVIPLVLILFYLLKEGIPGLSLDLFTSDPRRPGLSGGGVRNSIIGSTIMVGLGTVIGVPIAVACGIFMSEYGQNRAGTMFRFLVDVLAGIPSITMGLFVYSLLVLPMQRFTAIAGVLALAILIMPIVARTTEEMLQLVPRALREASLALGAPPWRTILTVILPAAVPGIATGVVLGLARISGEAAPLLFTALGNQFTSTDVLHAMDALPLRIFVYAIGPYDDWHQKAWAMSLILVTFIFAISAGIRWVSRSGAAIRH